MKVDEIKDRYDSYIQETVEDYLWFGKKTTTFHFLRGVAHGLGSVLGYEHSKVTEDINNAIAEAEKRQMQEAI